MMNLKGRRVLVTGGCGFLGHHIVEHLVRTCEAQVVVLDRLTYASSGLDRLRDTGLLEKVIVLTADLRQPLPVGVMREIGTPDFVVHAAAETHVDNSIRDPLPFVESNVLGTHHLLWWAKQAGVKRTFLVSTDEVYGPAPEGFKGYDVGDRFAPTNPYAAAKAGAECLAMAYAHTFGIPLTITTGMNFFGERQHPEKYIPLVIRKVLRGEKVLIHSDPTKTKPGSRFYLHCRTFADALTHLMSLESCPRKVHISGERELDNLTLALMIAEICGKPLNYELIDFHSSRPGHDLRYALDPESILATGWQYPMQMVESLARTVAWYLSRPEWLELEQA